MNNTEEITVYKDCNDQQSPTTIRRIPSHSYDFPEKSQKKEKKWSISSIFRRKKKEDSDSTSGEESHKKTFLSRRRKKTDSKRKRPAKCLGTFDHVVVHPSSKNSFAHNEYEENGVLSDPTGGFSNYIGRALPHIPVNTPNLKLRASSDDMNISKLSITSGSVDSSTRKNRREQVKARVEARRTSTQNDSSSDECSQRSNSSLKIRSEENLRSRDSLSHSKSRAARTERYLKRRSRDGENPYNFLRLSKSDVENTTLNWKHSDDSYRSPSQSPLVPSTLASINPNDTLYSSLNSRSTISGLSTIPPSHYSQSKYRVVNSTSNPSYKPLQSMNDYNNSTRKTSDGNSDKYFSDHRSISCDANIHKAPFSEFTGDVLYVQFPITKSNRGQRNTSLIDTSQLIRLRQPPPPPPRDPHRVINNTHLENGRPNTYYFDSQNQSRAKSFCDTSVHPPLQHTKKFHSFNIYPNYKSTSDDHLLHDSMPVHLTTRPSSTTPDISKSQRYITRDNSKVNPDDFNYLTDKHPRSRKPIFVQSGILNATGKSNPDNHNTYNALNFWKQIDRQNTSIEKPVLKKTRSDSPQMFTSHTQLQTKVFLPSVLHLDVDDASNNVLNHESTNAFKKVASKSKHVEAPQIEDLEKVTKQDIKRKSTNLEEALNELEAIYNSLRLGDEDLLERAEQREKETQTNRLLENAYPNYSARGALSDSNFSYEPFDTVDSPQRKRLLKKHRRVDVKHDDMAFRKLNKERFNTIGDPHNVVPKISYLMASPVHGNNQENVVSHQKSKEPDITFDDVVYRNVKHVNNALKIVEPQPPFGIPLGPIAPGANSDYLHAKPEKIFRPKFKSRKVPDIVKDDLAFRNLRKDDNKGPALPPLSTEDFKNNNFEENKLDLNYLKKKRAQMSLSANIAHLIEGNVLPQKCNSGGENEFKTLTDIADAMDIARKVLKEKESKISTTTKAFMSDTDTKYLKTMNDNDCITDRRMNFTNDFRKDNNDRCSKSSSPLPGNNIVSSKPPCGLVFGKRSPKESTPIPMSPLESKLSSNSSNSTSSSVDDMMNVLAAEAKETTEKITNELQLWSDDTEICSRLQKNDDVCLSKDTELNKTLSDIDAVSEHAKLCEKLLEYVVDSKDLVTSTKAEEEEVKQIDDHPAIVEAANVVLSRADDKEKESINLESDHDYENLMSDKELNVDEILPQTVEDLNDIESCRSPFIEHKEKLIASFQGLKNTNDMDMLRKTVDEGNKQNKDIRVQTKPIFDNKDLVQERSNEGGTDTKWLRSSQLLLPRWMWFYSAVSVSDQSEDMSENQDIRAERIARYKEERRRELAAQFSQHTESQSRSKNCGSANVIEGPRPTRTSRLRMTVLPSEKSPTHSVNGNDTKSLVNRRIDRDKSNKRKSNLNRSLASEEVPHSDDGDEFKNRRRRRRFFPAEVLEQPSKVTAPSLSNNSLSSTASSSSSKISSHKSELSIHMENARRGAPPAFSELGKYKPFTKRSIVSGSKSLPISQVVDSQLSDSKNSVLEDNSKMIANRMEELSSLTKETLARVERLANKNKDSPLKKSEISNIVKSERRLSNRNVRKANSVEKCLPSSILKKKNMEDSSSIIIESTHVAPCVISGPVSILKRKASQDEHNRSDNIISSNHTPPVTFSPSVVEPSTTKRKQGILKKRRSLDESTVLRHRSCSPDVVAYKSDSRSILKNQRRSSLEELRRTQSPESQLQGILKRKTSRNEDDDFSLNSPQGILKRRSGASSAGSTGSTPHVSITTAVILAAAGGAEIILDSENEHVKPILKKKSFSDDHSYHSDVSCDTPKPILKKKSSTETDDSEERPRPILKQHKSLEREILDTGQDTPKTLKHGSSSETECEYKPILKQTNLREESPRLRLSFCAENNSSEQEFVKRRTSRRSNTICTDFYASSSNNMDRENEDRVLRKARPLSVQELVMSFEKSCSTGAVPKRTNLKRSNDRYRTQPVTSVELEASLNLVNNPEEHSRHNYNVSNYSHSSDVNSLLDFATTLDNDSNLSNFFSSSLHNSTSPENLACGRMSDSAFQSLGDGLELEQEEDVSDNTTKGISKLRGKLESSNLEIQMKAIAEEAKKRKSEKGNTSIDRYRSKKSDIRDRFSTRFSTQPVTSEEVQEASKVNTNVEDIAGDSKFHSSEHRSILKTPENSRNRVSPPENATKSALKKCNMSNCLPRRRNPIIKLETTSPDKDDEGISSNDSASDSGDDARSSTDIGVLQKRYGKSGDSTSEGESSGGREIRSIFRNENQLKLKNSLENILSKSRSQGIFGNDVASRSHPKNTASVQRSQTQREMPRTIADLRVKLQESGESGWRKRVPLKNNATDEVKLLKEKYIYNNELSEKSLLATKKDELDASAKQWKVRVEKSDAEKFSVAGKMGDNMHDASINISGCDNKRIPQAKRFKLKEGSNSRPTSPEKSSIFDLTRSKSAPYSPVPDLSGVDTPNRTSARKVLVPDLDDVTFKTFFKSVEQSKNSEHIELSLDDFDSVERHSLLVLKKNVQVQKRRTTTRNPIKALASRTDISNEYTEVITGVAEREIKRLHIEKLSKNSNKALEALAGLASNEDFKSVALKKPSQLIALLPWKDLMLLQVKGRRHVQTRLVEPTASSINEGDSFILITPTVLYNYIGTYSNVIEQSRAADIVNHIQKTGDMGCKTNKVIIIKDQESSPKHVTEFWKLLGLQEPPLVVGAGHPNEDETYESNILHTNMIYTLQDDELLPHEKFWGSIPKIEMLDQSNIFVFDFGSEMYVWSGKNAPIDKKKIALKLAKEIWDDGYNYSECNVCPLNIASVLGARDQMTLQLQANERPSWAIFAKITQHRETILFREKFLDWPDFSRVIKVKTDDESIKEFNVSFDISPCNVDEMLQEKEKNPDLFIDNTHLGRGDKYYDEETRRYFQYETLKIKAWRILENSHEELQQKSIGQFFDGNSYIYCWNFRQTVKGRELNGNPSKRAPVGRDRCIFFCWHGCNSSISEKCTAAFLTVELDKQSAPQLRITQGSEPAAFLSLFNGNMIIYNGKHGDPEGVEKPRLFISRGELENEIYLMEVPLNMSSLRSRSCFVIINIELALITIWHGSKSTEHKRRMIRVTVDKLLRNKPTEMKLEESEDNFDVVEVEEGEENDDFFDIFGDNKETYHSLLDCTESYNHTMRMYHFSSITGNFLTTEILCPHRSEHATPYPFVQHEMYAASQPALYLFDNNHELWLWQGWWPEKEDELEDLSDQIGSRIIRFHAERRAAMQTAVNYWKKRHGDEKPIQAYLVWAGVEPLKFTNLFPMWKEKSDVRELNEKEGKTCGEILLVERELSLLSRTTYPLVELLQRPLPEGVDPTHIEKYLSPNDFEDLLSLTKEEFDKLPSWKQTALKKEKGLF